MNWRFSPKFKQKIEHKIFALIPCLLFFSASCATLKPTHKPYTTSLSIEGQYYKAVFNDFLNLFKRKGIKLITESLEKGQIETDWLYFSKPGTSWRFRYNLVLSFAEDKEQPNTVQVSAAAQYQGGIPIRQDPFRPGSMGYDWGDIPPDQYLIVNLNDFFMSLKNNIDPIRSNIILPDPQKIRRVIYRLKGISPESIESFPFDGTQRIINFEDEYTDIQTSSEIFHEKNAVTIPVSDKKYRQFLRPSVFCQYEDPMVKRTAQEIIGDEKNSWKAVKKIAAWLKKEITPAYNFSFATAKDALTVFHGDCSEYTVLGAAFCRAVGIPARAVLGIMYNGGIFNYHLWLEVYVGKWMSVDPQFFEKDEATGEYYTDATHLKFFWIDLGDNTVKVMNQFMSNIMGKLKIEILDYSEAIE